MQERNIADDAMLSAFLDGHPDARDQMPRFYHDRLLGLARRIAPDLDEQDLAEDAVQRTWELLLRKRPDSFDPDRGSAIAYLTGVLLNAANDVRAEHAPPGEPTRRRNNWYRKPTRGQRRAYVRALVLNKRHEDPDDLGPPESPMHRIPDPHDYIAELECRLTVRDILKLARVTMPHKLYFVLRHVAGRDALLGEAARAWGMHRTTARRYLTLWANDEARRIRRLLHPALGPTVRYPRDPRPRPSHASPRGEPAPTQAGPSS